MTLKDLVVVMYRHFVTDLWVSQLLIVRHHIVLKQRMGESGGLPLDSKGTVHHPRLRSSAVRDPQCSYYKMNSKEFNIIESYLQ